IAGGVPGGARNVEDLYPLAPLQEGILFHHLLSTEGDAYLLSNLFRFESRALLDAFLDALQSVIARHAILRTAVLWEGLSEPVQVVWREAPLPVEEVVPDPAQPDVAEQLRVRFDPRHYRIDVGKAPLLRAYVAQETANGPWLCLMLLHHLAGDHTTLEVIQEEVHAYLQGRADQLPEAVPFRNFVALARLGVSPQEHEEFFRNMLEDVDEATAPFGLLDVRGDGSALREASLRVEAGLAQRLRERARKLGVSAATLCHVAWAQVLARSTGHEDVVFGTVRSGRVQGGESADRVMGMFINTLPVRIRIGDESVEASVRRTHALLAGLMFHEHASLVLAQRCSGVPAPAPLFSALLNYRHGVEGVSEAPSAEAYKRWEGAEVLHSEERSNYPFALSVDDLGAGFLLTAQVHVSIDPAQVCELMHTALEGLTGALETTPATALRSVDILPASVRRQVVEELNATHASFPTDRCVHELFEAQVATSPDAVAVVQGEIELSYAELNARANQLAHYLLELGVKPDGLVAICVERSVEMVVGLLAVLKAGGAYVPLDPAYPVERLRQTLEDSGSAVLLTQGRLQGLFAGRYEVIDLSAAVPPWASLPDTNPDRSSAGPKPEHLAYVIYTSGSTGVPKGVMVEHGSLANLAWAAAREYELGSADRVLQFASIAFDAAAEEIYPTLSTGGTLILRTEEMLISAREFLLQCEQLGISVLDLPTAYWHVLVDALGSGQARLPGSVRLVIIGGEAAAASALKTWHRAAGERPRLVNSYGPTETTVVATLQTLTPDTFASGAVPIGRPIANTAIYILDSLGRPVPSGVVGEMHIGGVQVARGYLNRPELTAERFVADPFSGEPAARMYKTGDLGRWLPDGNIEFLGRNDFQVKL
ncbi:MAG: non-ribosomal peptide synthetase, partial [Acidobacteria bacterium]|nr:non-ribosomal peptide synthetase [Acidobacteriota bacterium]